MNYPAARSDIYFAKHVTNDIDFFLKDIDRKAVVLDGETLILRISDRVAGKVLLTLSLLVVDTKKGRYRATVPPLAIEDFALGSYSYAVTRRATDGTERLCYSDRGRTELGLVEVREGPVPPESAAFTIMADDLLPLDADLLSSALPGSATVGNIEGVMSIAVYGNHFTGAILAEASLDPEAPTEESAWFPLVSTSYTDLTGVSSFPIEANLTWVRFRVRDMTETNGQSTTGTNGVSCIACSLGDEASEVENPIVWPAETKRGIVKIVYRA